VISFYESTQHQMKEGKSCFYGGKKSIDDKGKDKNELS